MSDPDLYAGDVPEDSLEERILREEPEVLTPQDDRPDVALVEPEPDGGLDADFADQAMGEQMHSRQLDGTLTADGAEPAEGPIAAEEAAVHVTDRP